jgi:diaminohydroxyphosphoribosylaminopyrimidine deaminase/5-amino-6-(5-phosphoribosylamino)uracil reductase
MVAKTDREFMQRALVLAERARGFTAPNPMVGAVVVKGQQIVGEGYHHQAGDGHAEALALKRAGHKAKGATIYVSLEPCCHQGRTGPCTEAILKAGIREVVVAATDSNPLVAGKGVRRLRQAGLKVRTGLMRPEARRLNEVHFHWFEQGRPFVTLKMAQTLDGRIATSTGDSRWISSKLSRRMAHQLRADADGVLVGMGTVRHDNPSLTVRHVKGHDPYRIVMTGSAKFPAKCTLLSSNDDCRTIVATTQRSIERFVRSRRARGVTSWTVGKSRQGIDIKDFMSKAADFGLRSILIEGGSELATSFLKAGLVDKYVVAVAPMLLGNGTDSVGDLEIVKVANALKFESVTYEPCGPDVIFTGYLTGKK